MTRFARLFICVNMNACICEQEKDVGVNMFIYTKTPQYIFGLRYTEENHKICILYNFLLALNKWVTKLFKRLAFHSITIVQFDSTRAGDWTFYTSTELQHPYHCSPNSFRIKISGNLDMIPGSSSCYWWHWVRERENITIDSFRMNDGSRDEKKQQPGTSDEKRVGWLTCLVGQGSNIGYWAKKKYRILYTVWWTSGWVGNVPASNNVRFGFEIFSKFILEHSNIIF